MKHIYEALRVANQDVVEAFGKSLSSHQWSMKMRWSGAMRFDRALRRALWVLGARNDSR